jgi:hypothetical protein
MTSQHQPPPAQPSVTDALAARPGAVAVAAIWLATILSAVLAPDMVHGSAQEHLPLAALAGWPWALTATAYVVITAHENETMRSTGFALTIGVIWLAVAVVSILGPVLVTGTDPTRIPLAAVIAPVLGMAATGATCLLALRSRG